jgi:hypothetical protein
VPTFLTSAVDGGVSGHHYALSALPSRNKLPVPIVQEAAVTVATLYLFGVTNRPPLCSSGQSS